MQIAGGFQDPDDPIPPPVWWHGWTSEPDVDWDVVEIVFWREIHLGPTPSLCHVCIQGEWAWEYIVHSQQNDAGSRDWLPHRYNVPKERRWRENCMSNRLCGMDEASHGDKLWDGQKWTPEGYKKAEEVLWSENAKQVLQRWWVGAEMVPTSPCWQAK